MWSALPILLLFTQPCPPISGQSIPPDPEDKDTSASEFGVFAIDADSSPTIRMLSKELPSVLKFNEAEQNAENVQKNGYSDSNEEEQPQEPSTYVVMFKDEKSRLKVMADLNRGRELSEDSDTKSKNVANSISSIPRYEAEVLQFASTQDYESWLQTNDAHIQNSCPNDRIITEGKNCKEKYC